MLFSLITVLMNRPVSPELIVIITTAGLWIMLGGYDCSGMIRSRFLDLLGAVSLPMFIWSTVVGKYISQFTGDIFYGKKIALYYIITIVISVLSYFAVQRFKRSVE
jgi:peptidoglycan/LPS O-acetylase OafA/YrhL